MRPELEKYLWDEISKNGHGKPFAMDVINEMVKSKMINSHKQAWRTLEKWVDKGWFDYGCRLDLGWKNNYSRINDISITTTKLNTMDDNND